MKVLVIGSGGREHALVESLRRSARVSKIFCAPGNAGIAEFAECVEIQAHAITDLLHFAQTQKIDLTIVGPEQPLVEGIVDQFEKAALPIFGPRKNAAILEASKAFTKAFCERHKIPAAKSQSFTDFSKALQYAKNQHFPLVVKADGLAAGKGVVICQHFSEAETALKQIMQDKIFGEAGQEVVLEEFLSGVELSYMAITDGKHLVPLASAQDHKKIGEGETGPNTGGMGTLSPSPLLTPVLEEKILQQILLPTVRGMAQEAREFVGVLFAGLMIVNNEPYLLEYNTRFGDPETQVVLSRLQSDLLELFEAALSGKLDKISLSWDARSAVCVVMAAGGYPTEYEKNKVIHGLERSFDDCWVYHAGTKRAGKELLTNGGRVLGVTALGKNLTEARKLAYAQVEQISWDGVYYRRDIAELTPRK